MAQLAERTPGGVLDLVSKRSVRYRELGLKDRELSTEEWLDLLEKEPKMLRRPLVVGGDKLVIGYDETGLQALLRD